jgi:integrase
MRWDELDADKRILTIPGARTKNGLVHVVPLPPAAWDIIRAQPRICDHVFTTTGKGPIRNIDRAKARLDAELRFRPWRIHDCRRSVASGLQPLGVSVEVIEATLNHRSGTFRGIVGVYQRHDFADEKRAALTRWADHIERLATGKPANVVAFPR